MGSIDRSSWVSWLSYALAYALAYGPKVDAELGRAGPGLWILLGGVAAFFAIIIPIQRYMDFSLKANTYGTPKRLVTTGPFRWSRNPIYVTFLIPLATLAWFSVPAALAGIAVYLTAMTFYVIAHEDAVLVREFGAEFAEYRARTPRWIGF